MRILIVPDSTRRVPTLYKCYVFVFYFQNVRDAAKNVLKWTSRTAGVVSSSDLGAGQETLEYFVQVSQLD